MTDWIGKLYDDKTPQGGGLSPILSPGKSQALYRSFGLGAAPDILGGAQFGLQKILAGKSPFSAEGETPQQLQQETAGNQFVDPTKTGGATQAGQDLAGMASWMVPDVNIAKGAGPVSGFLSGILNHAVQGAAQGGLGAVSQGQNPTTGAEVGAVVNPTLTGAGNVLTDLLPRYIGFRNFGPKGVNLPEVTKAEQGFGDTSLQDVKNTVAGNVSDFSIDDKNKLIDQVTNISKDPSYVGAPGISELKKMSSRAGVRNVGALNDVVTSISNSSDPFEAYNRVRNLAYPEFQGTDAGNKLQSFLHTASHTLRENLINSSEDPVATRKIMDLYAAQTAMSRGGGLTSSLIPGGEAGLGALATLLPALHGLGIAGMADAALTNPLTGPPLAKGLVRTGQTVGSSGLSSILSRLGVGGVQGLLSPSPSSSPTP